MAAARSPPGFEPANKKFLRPRATTRSARSAALLSISSCPSSTYRVSARQRERVADRGRGIGLAGELRERSFQPDAHAVEQGFCPALADHLPDLRRAAPDLGFYRVE